MADNLQNKILNNARTFKQGGQLGQTSSEELTSLSNAAERPSVPTSPLEASAIGASPDSYKMAGVSPNKLNALRQSVRADMSLSDSQRQEQARKQSTAGEQSQQAKGQALQGLGDMNNRVQELADKMLTGEGQQFSSTLKADTAKLQAALPPGTDAAQAEQLLNKLGANQATSQDILALAGMFGITGTSNLSALENQLKTSFLSAGEQAGQMAASALADNITIAALSPEQLQSLGFADINAMAAALNVTPEQLSATTVGDLKGTFGNLQAVEFSQVDQLKAVLADPARSSTEKQQALKMLREAGAVGTGASEQDVQRIEDQLLSADTVKFFGKDYSIEELLNNENISGLVRNYFDNPEINKQLKEQEPAFAAWIEENKGILAEAAQDVDEDIAAFSTIQTNNIAKAKVPGTGTSLSDDVMKELYEDWGELRADELEDNALIGTLQDENIPADFRGSLASGVNQLASVDKALVKDLADTSYEEMARAGLTGPAGITSYVNYASKIQQLNSLPADAAIDEAFSGLSEEDLLDLVKETRVMNTSGLTDPIDEDILSLMDGDRNSVLDDPELRKANIISYLTKGKGSPLTVKEMAAQGQKVQELPDPLAEIRDLKANIQSSNDLYQKVAPFIRDGDGVLMGSEVPDLVKNTDISINDLATLQKRLKLKDNATDAAIDDAITSKTVSAINESLKTIGQNTKRVSKLIDKAWAGKLSDGERAEISAMYSQIKQMVKDKEFKNPLAQLQIENYMNNLYNANHVKLNKFNEVQNFNELREADKRGSTFVSDEYSYDSKGKLQGPGVKNSKHTDYSIEQAQNKKRYRTL